VVCAGFNISSDLVMQGMDGWEFLDRLSVREMG